MSISLVLMNGAIIFFSHAVRCCRNRSEFFSNALLKSMKGAGTDEATLNRVMVSRSEIDMEDIKEVFKKKNGKTLYSYIKVSVRERERWGYISCILPPPPHRVTPVETTKELCWPSVATNSQFLTLILTPFYK